MDKDDIVRGIERNARALNVLVAEMSASGRLDHEAALRLAEISGQLFAYAWKLR